MANIKISVNHAIRDGFAFSFLAPCNCSDVEGIVVEHLGGTDRFVFKDAHGNALTDLNNLFTKGALVKVIFDVTHGGAYLQNADTNSYLEDKFKAVTMTATDPFSDGRILFSYGGVVGEYIPNAEGVSF